MKSAAAAAAISTCTQTGMPRKSVTSPTTLPKLSIRKVKSRVSISITRKMAIRISQPIHAHWSMN